MGTVNARLVWLDGRTPTMMQDVDAEAEVILQLPDGHHHFSATEEIAMDGYVIFRERDDEEGLIRHA